MGGANVIQLLSYAAIMASSIIVPLMAQSFGASAGWVGLIVGAYNAFYFLSTYLFGLLADKYGGKQVLRLGLFVSALCFALQIFAHDLFSLLLVRSLTGAAVGIFPAALAVYAYSEQGGKMGKFTGAGSLGWAVGGVLAGLIASNQAIFAMSSIFFGSAFCLALQMRSGFQPPGKVRLLPLGTLRRNARIYVPYFFRALGAQAIWSIFPLYLVLAGADMRLVGAAYFVNAFSQFFIMRYVERFKNLYLVNIGLLCSILTFIGYALFPQIWVILGLQLLLAYSFSTLQVGTQQELLSKNMERATAISLLNAITNITAVIGPFLAGGVAELWGYAGVMWLGAAITFIGLISFTTVLE